MLSTQKLTNSERERQTAGSSIPLRCSWNDNHPGSDFDCYRCWVVAYEDLGKKLPRGHSYRTRNRNRERVQSHA